MKIKVAEATGPVLDWMVADCDGELAQADFYLHESTGALMLERGEVAVLYSPSTRWAHGGPIIEREHISTAQDHSGLWIAYIGWNYSDFDHMQCDRSLLIAAMRCFVASRLGDEVEVPEGLT